MESIVKVVGLSHHYTTQWAVRDVNFEISSHGVVGLLGSNGAGKSTTMNIICGVLNQTEGDIFIKDINLRENPVEAKKHVGFLPQRPPVYGDLNVEEYLTYCAELRLMAKEQIPTAVEEAMKRCGILHFRRRLIRNLSGGYQQRVGIAQAIVHKPEFVVLDEPTNGLDPNQIVEIRELIKEIATDRAVLLSTHILSEVQATCQQIIMIEHGNIVFKGSIAEFDNYIEPNSFMVELATPPAKEELGKIDGISQVEQLSPTRFRLTFDKKKETMKKFVSKAVSSGWGLSECVLQKVSLDEIFAELSGKREKGVQR
ncbi:MAG: ABC transporter ATP-binding protein [Bacteroidales bacterium]|nr:ABC transporter ATP-binding protein [Bacteroidales bacterium]